MYVEGGNSYYLLQESQKNNFGEYVKKRVGEGMIYIGTSAGSVIMGPDIEPVRREETTPLAPDLKGTKAYNIVNFVIMPHWGSEDRRSLYSDYRIQHIYHEDFPYVLLTDNQYIEVQDDWFTIVDVTKE
jgi:dipeptidase E